jgi:tetratricopeptide (TPR) repeat protein
VSAPYLRDLQLLKFANPLKSTRMKRAILPISLLFALQTTLAGFAADDLTALNNQLTKLNKAIQENDKDKTLFEERANCFIGLSKFKESIDDCDKAIALDGQDLRAYHLRAVADRGLGQVDQAKADEAKLVTIADQLSAKNSGKEIEAASEKIKKEPKNAAAYVNRASGYLNLKQYDNAIADATTAITLDPKCKAAYLTRMGAYVALHRNVDANADRAKFNRIDSKDTSQFSADAVTDYSRILGNNPKDKNALQNRAQAYVLLAKYKEAMEDLNTLIAIDPACVPAFRLRASCYKKLNDPMKARADLKQASTLEKKDQ